jgi:serine/threonine protein kinase
VTAPLDGMECELLEAVADRDDGAIEVINDYWIERDVQRWSDDALAAGFTEHDLATVDGFAQYPLCVEEGSPLDEHPDLVRLSPRYYRVADERRRGVECVVFDAEAITPRTRTRVVIKEAVLPRYHDVIEHEHLVLQGITHPNVVRCDGWATRPQRRALALQWCGSDLQRLLRAAREHGRLLGVDFALSVGAQLFAALAAIHAAGVVHREIRSDHVAVTADGTVRVIDFGTSRFLDGRQQFDRHDRYISPGFHDADYRFRYMAPELARGLEVTEVCDVWSATSLVCELVTNEHYAQGETGFDILNAILHGEPAPPVSVPPRSRLVLALGYERDAARRTSAAEMRDALVRSAAMDRVEIGPHVIARRLVELGVPC